MGSSNYKSSGSIAYIVAPDQQLNNFQLSKKRNEMPSGI